jgi:hypothetical protein
MNVLRLAGAMTVAMIGGFILLMRRREKRGHRDQSGPTTPATN